MSVKIAFLELRFEHERKCFDEIIKKKAKRIAYLDSPAFFHDPKSDFMKGHKEKEKLEPEVKAMYGYMCFADLLKGAYIEEIDAMADMYDRDLDNGFRVISNLLRKKDEEIHWLTYQVDRREDTIELFSNIIMDLLQKNEQNRRHGAEPLQTA